MSNNESGTLTALDRLEIIETLGNYGRFHDERDFGRLAACFDDEATYRVTVRGESMTPMRHGATEIVDQIKEFKKTQSDQRRHVITNFSFATTGETVAVESYVTVFAVDPDDVLSAVTVGRYSDELVRAGSAWKIRSKRLDVDRGF